jgi:hypothetical protein
MPQHVEFGVLREHTIDPAGVYEITLRGAPPAGLTARFPPMFAQRATGGHSSLARGGRSSGDRRPHRAAALDRNHATAAIFVGSLAAATSPIRPTTARAIIASP